MHAHDDRPGPRWLVTGGAGFIGSHLTGALLARGARVTVLDDLSTGSLGNLDGLAATHGGALEVVEGSTLDPGLTGPLVERADTVVHLAAAVGVKLIVERPVHTIVNNVEGTRVVLEAAARHGTPVLLASTSEVYGKGERVPFAEDDDLRLGPTTRWAYACSKALDEWLGLAYHREQGLPITVLRLFNVVGPRQTGRYGMVLPTFAGQALRGEPITVYGSGAQTRCVAHVSYVVEALLRLADCPEAVGRRVNVGSDEEVSIAELAERVRRLAHSRSPIVRVPFEEAYASGFEDMARRVPDVTRLRQLTGFRPATPLDATIRDVLDHVAARTAAAGGAADRRPDAP